MSFAGKTHKPESNRKRSDAISARYRDDRPEGMGFPRKYATAEEARAGKSRANRVRQLKCRYGISIETYEQMLRNQEGRCAICPTLDIKGKPLHVDHDHETGQVRGLLCRRCNNMLGMAGDSVEILGSAMSYLADT